MDAEIDIVLQLTERKARKLRTLLDAIWKAETNKRGVVQVVLHKKVGGEIHSNGFGEIAMDVSSQITFCLKHYEEEKNNG